MKTLLAIDIGNTNIKFAPINKKSVKEIFVVSSQLKDPQLSIKLVNILRKIRKLHKNIDDVILCSVVPRLSKVVSEIIVNEFDQKPLIIGKDIIVPIRNKYAQPKQVGQDRLVGAFATKEIYGFPAIIIDFGTAITFDVISAKGDYDGGMIVPGIKLSAETLFNKAALLPNVKQIRYPKNLVGKTTEESILSGLVHGYGTMSMGLIKLLEKRIKGKPKIIVTGGHLNLFKRLLKNNSIQYVEDLIFQGLNLLYHTIQDS